MLQERFEHPELNGTEAGCISLEMLIDLKLNRMEECYIICTCSFKGTQTQSKMERK